MVIPVLSILGIIHSARRCSASFQIIQNNNFSVIDYEPADNWRHLPGDCDGCTSPSSNLLINSAGTWTNGTNTPKTTDADDTQPSKGFGSGKGPQKDKGRQNDDNDNDGDGDDTGPDVDDPNFVPTPVTVTFRFTGSSFALHALFPPRHVVCSPSPINGELVCLETPRLL